MFKTCLQFVKLCTSLLEEQLVYSLSVLLFVGKIVNKKECFYIAGGNAIQSIPFGRRYDNISLTSKDIIYPFYLNHSFILLVQFKDYTTRVWYHNNINNSSTNNANAMKNAISAYGNTMV